MEQVKMSAKPMTTEPKDPMMNPMGDTSRDPYGGPTMKSLGKDTHLNQAIGTEPKSFGQITKEGVEGAEKIRRKELETALRTESMSDTESNLEKIESGLTACLVDRHIVAQQVVRYTDALEVVRRVLNSSHDANKVVKECDEELCELLEELEVYFDGMADAEYFTDRAAPVPNEEMSLLVRVQAALLKSK